MALIRPRPCTPRCRGRRPGQLRAGHPLRRLHDRPAEDTGAHPGPAGAGWAAALYTLRMLWSHVVCLREARRVQGLTTACTPAARNSQLRPPRPPSCPAGGGRPCHQLRPAAVVCTLAGGRGARAEALGPGPLSTGARLHSTLGTTCMIHSWRAGAVLYSTAHFFTPHTKRGKRLAATCRCRPVSSNTSALFKSPVPALPLPLSLCFNKNCLTLLVALQCLHGVLRDVRHEPPANVVV